MWQLNDVRALAIKHLDTMNINGMERLRLAKTYDIQRWWIPGLQAAAEQKMVTEEDTQTLGVPLCLKVATLQGQVSGQRRHSAHEHDWDCKH